jgi:nitrogen regulatory protein P-II 1
MKAVTAIVRTTSLERVVHALEHSGIKRLTISEIKGTGEEVRLRSSYTIHDKVEIFVPDERVDAVVRLILENSGTGLAGDGVITIAPLDYAVKIRTEERIF